MPPLVLVAALLGLLPASVAGGNAIRMHLAVATEVCDDDDAGGEECRTQSPFDHVYPLPMACSTALTGSFFVVFPENRIGAATCSSSDVLMVAGADSITVCPDPQDAPIRASVITSMVPGVSISCVTASATTSGVALGWMLMLGVLWISV